jgi:hypothetical protein
MGETHEEQVFGVLKEMVLSGEVEMEERDGELFLLGLSTA